MSNEMIQSNQKKKSGKDRPKQLSFARSNDSQKRVAYVARSCVEERDLYEARSLRIGTCHSCGRPCFSPLKEGRLVAPTGER